jgi:hypothetical protein
MVLASIKDGMIAQSDIQRYKTAMAEFYGMVNQADSSNGVSTLVSISLFFLQAH